MATNVKELAWRRRRGGGGGEREEEEEERRKQSDNKMALYTYLSIITLDVNGLNVPTKSRRVAEWLIK